MPPVQMYQAEEHGRVDGGRVDDGRVDDGQVDDGVAENEPEMVPPVATVAANPEEEDQVVATVAANANPEEEDQVVDRHGKSEIEEEDQVVDQHGSSSALDLTDSEMLNQVTRSSSGSSSALDLTDSEMLHQLVSMVLDVQERFTGFEVMVATSITEECERLEVALGQRMQKALRSSFDAMWAQFQEGNMKRDEAAPEFMQQLTDTINNCLAAITEKWFDRELTAVGIQTFTLTIEKTISTSIAETFQKWVGDKAVNQLEKSVDSAISARLQTSLQESMKSCFEVYAIPAFEKACRSMFEQIDATFRKGMIEHTAAAHQQFDTSHSALAIALRDAINSASSTTQTLSSEILDGQRKLLALAVAGSNPLVSQLSKGPLLLLIAEGKYEEAFTTALQSGDVTIVSFLCSQVDLRILSMNPLPLSQVVLLCLLQQLAFDISKETSQKLTWMTKILPAINPTDPTILEHVRPIFQGAYQKLNDQHNLPTTSGVERSTILLIMYALNGMLMNTI